MWIQAKVLLLPGTLPNLLSGSRCDHICTQSLHLQKDCLIRLLMVQTLKRFLTAR